MMEMMLYKGTVRCGQKVSSPGGLVVLGDVNPGGELVAQGDIVVMGALRGLAHAGAGGQEGCVVSAVCMQPTQLRIAGLIARPDGFPPARCPEVAGVAAGNIEVCPLARA